jgi:hypothetical protein
MHPLVTNQDKQKIAEVEKQNADLKHSMQEASVKVQSLERLNR